VSIQVRSLFVQLTGGTGVVTTDMVGKWRTAVRRELANHILHVCHAGASGDMDDLIHQSRFWMALASLAVFKDKTWLTTSSQYRSLLDQTSHVVVWVELFLLCLCIT
jgi:hypothetical protein